MYKDICIAIFPVKVRIHSLCGKEPKENNIIRIFAVPVECFPLLYD